MLYPISTTLEGYPFVLLTDKPVLRTVGGFKLDKTTKERLKKFQVALLYQERNRHGIRRRSSKPSNRPAA